MKKKLKRWHYILFFSSIVLFLATTIIISVSLLTTRNNLNFSQLLGQFDGLLMGEGDYQKLSGILDAAAQKANSVNNWLSVAKRAIILGRYRDDYELSSEILTKGVKRYPGNSSIRALATYSSLKIGEIDSARHFSVSLENHEQFRSFRKLALFTHGTSSELVGPKKEFETLQSFNHLLPALKNGETFFAIGEVLHDNRMHVDAALTELHSQNFSTALEYLANLSTQQSKKIRLEVYFDQKKYNKFLDEYEKVSGPLQQDLSLLLLKAEALVRTGRINEGSILYSTIFPVLQGDQKLSVGLNLLYLFQQRDENWMANSIIDGLRQSNGDDVEVRLAEIRQYLRSDDWENAFDAAQFFSTQDVSPGLFHFIAYLVGNEMSGTSIPEDKLWHFRTMYPQEEVIGSFLVWYFFVTGNDFELARILEELEITASTAVYRAYIKAKLNKFDNALAEYTQLDIPITTSVAFNLGLLHVMNRDFSTAAEILELQYPDPSMPIAAKYYALSAYVHMYAGSESLARDELEIALKLDPTLTFTRRIRAYLAFDQ